MKARLLQIIETVRSSYWFLPVIMLLGSLVMAFGLVSLDQRVDTESLRGLWWIFSGGADGARALLSTVAGSAIAVAGTTFSITMAVLSLTSSQFGPRLLRGFMRDTGNQFVLGTFVATFLYCLLVMRTVRSVEEAIFVPHIAVTGGVFLAVATVCVLIFFIHHVAVSIQASHIISVVASELEEAVDRLFPERIGHEAGPRADSSAGHRKNNQAREVVAQTSGYVQGIDGDALLAVAEDNDLRIDLQCAPGGFVRSGGMVALVSPAEAVDTAIQKHIIDAIALGEQRTAMQDVEFLLLQLAEMAVRALSPGINDPFTAVMCLDRLSAALCDLAGRAMPSPLRYGEKGILRVTAEPVSFSDMVAAALGEISHYGAKDPMVVRRLRSLIDEVSDCARTESQREVLRREAGRLRDFA